MIKRILKWTFSLILLALIVWFEIAYWTSSNDCDRKNAAAPASPTPVPSLLPDSRQLQRLRRKPCNAQQWPLYMLSLPARGAPGRGSPSVGGPQSIRSQPRSEYTAGNT